MKIKIKNFKSIIDQELKLDKNINFIIGKNESGKSNILLAIEAIKNKSIDSKSENFNLENEKIQSIITFEYQISKKILNEWKEIGFKENKFLIKQNITFDGLKFYYSDNKINSFIYNQLNKKYTLNELKKEKIFDSDLIYNLQIKNDIKDEGLKEKIIELIDKTKNFENSFKISKFNEFDLLQQKYTYDEAINSTTFMSLWSLLKLKIKDLEKLNTLEKDSDDFLDFKASLSQNLEIELENFIKDFWNQKTIKFKIEIEQDGIHVRAADQFDEEKLGKFRNIKFRSEGMKHYLSLILFINFEKGNAINENIKKYILINEPDKNLHAAAILDLNKYLEKVSQNNLIKFVIATHSPFFINENNFDSFTFLLKNNKNKGTEIVQNFALKNDEETKSTISPFIYQLGIDTKSFIDLHEKKIVFVEGFHDMLLLKMLAKKLKLTNKIIFIPLGSSTKKSSLVNLTEV